MPKWPKPTSAPEEECAEGDGIMAQGEGLAGWDAIGGATFDPGTLGVVLLGANDEYMEWSDAGVFTITITGWDSANTATTQFILYESDQSTVDDDSTIFGPSTTYTWTFAYTPGQVLAFTSIAAGDTSPQAGASWTLCSE
jgi:hypothetical protein